MPFNYGITLQENLLQLWSQTFIKVNYIVENSSTKRSWYAEDQITIASELLTFEQIPLAKNILFQNCLRQKLSKTTSLHSLFINVCKIYFQTIGAIQNLLGGVYSLDIGPIPEKRTKRSRQNEIANLPKVAFCSGKSIYEIELN